MTVDRNIPVEFTVKNTYEVADTRFVEVSIKLMHTNENYNGSYFSKETVESALPSLANTPILCYIEENKNGEIDYSDHRQVLVKEDGEYKIKYIGQAIGVIPESNNARFEKITTESGVEREYLTVDGLLWTKWDEPIDIIQRDSKHQQSMEIHKNYEGRFEEDNLFHFTSFQFFGACALSNIDIAPAMEEASIELKFSLESFQREIQEKMEQFKNFTLQNQSSTDVDDITFSQEGGNELVDKLEELLAKYSLTQESLTFSIEELSLEEVETKIQEHFAKLASEKRDEISRTISEEKFTDRWGDKCSKYSYVDNSDADVFVYDRQDHYRLYGFTYSMEGDAIKIDFESKKRKKFEITDFVEGVTIQFDSLPQEILDYELASKERELKEQFEIDKEKAVSEVQILLDTVTSEFELAKPELQRLKDFEVGKLTEERATQETELFSLYEEKLKDVKEFEALKAKASEFSLVSDLEKELALLYVKETANFSTSKTQGLRIAVPKGDSTEDSPYGGIVEKYLNK